MSKQFDIKFEASGRRKAQCPANPDFPNGIDVDISQGKAPSCIAKLPYPAPECGVYLVGCRLCDFKVAITSVGRADDPISVKIPCLLVAERGNA